MAALLAVGLLLVAHGYGYSRDELYFLACARHLAWGYPDQPPLVPVIAGLMAAIAPHSVVVLRLPAIAAAVATVVLTGLIAREMGAEPRAQLLAAAAMAASLIVLVSGNLLETSSLALALWSLIVWLIQRTLRTGSDRLWVVVGAISGVALMESDLVAGLLGAVIIGIWLAGPRRVFSSPWFYGGAVLALLIWSPYLAWQAAHGWPELAVARGISAGYSGTSNPRWLVIPEQPFLMGIFLTPILVVGFLRLGWDRALPTGRMWFVAYIVLALAIIAAGGKSYYLVGLNSLLMATGAGPTVTWARRGRRRLRTGLVALGWALNFAFLPVALPLVPVTSLAASHLVKINSTLGESVGWRTYVREMAAVYHALPRATQEHTIVLASNYGEAGAVNLFGSAYGLPMVYSGHMSYWYWGPPPALATTAVAVGFARSELTGLCGTLRLAGHLNNHLNVQDEEQGNPIWVCSQLKVSWAQAWPALRNFG